MSELPGDETKLFELLKLREEIERQIQGKYRRKAAILFADLIGSTAFYERHGDEAGRAEVARAMGAARSAIEPAGRVIKTLGDGVLAVFDDPAAAFQAAHRLVDGLADARLPARAAIHWGELLVEEADVYGDVVNTTARLNGLASTPCVLLSEAFVQALPDAVRRSCVRVGTFRVKGKADDLEVYARGEGDLVLDGGRLWTRRVDEASAATVRLVRTPLWPPMTQAFACSHTSFRHHFEKFARDERLGERREAWSVRTISTGAKPIPCWVYDFDKFGRLDSLLAELRAWTDRGRIREVALRLPHRYRAVELEVGVEATAAFWASKPGPAALSLVFSDADPAPLALAAARGVARGAPADASVRLRVKGGIRIEGATSDARDGWFEATVAPAERVAPGPAITGT